ncbi:MAG: hypothetical protein JST04_17250 [Bdellovibrionales bacterium]|nr:hypothetical protein [Bdellovibrionales bacterium]
MGPILNVSFYRFTRLDDLARLRERVKARAAEAGLKGTILLAEEGINGFLAGSPERLRSYLSWLFAEVPGLAGLEPKESFSADIPFTRLLVKLKREIITMGRPEVNPATKTGRNLPARELKRWYDEKKDFVIVDTRNVYEIAQGAFAGAIHYDIETFREFPEKLADEAAKLRDKTVVMYCTGGIRCEKATALAMDLGIRDVFQLEGGILKYFEETGGAHYEGDCFVFDHRTAVDPSLESKSERAFREKTADLVATFPPNDPMSARVEIALQTKGIPYARESAADFGLRHGGRAIGSIAEALEYLDEAFPETPSLSPDRPERIARMAEWTAWVDRELAPAAKEWIELRGKLSPEERSAPSVGESLALEIRLEKLLYRLKTPLQRSRRFLVLDAPTRADLAAYAWVRALRAADFPRDYPERFALVWDWMAAVEGEIEAGLNPAPKVLRRAGSSIWPN